ncbi:hypothetical protein DIPPA_04235 [Diplonema papillatum]|nr:hypothetical protein DIPPA_04235 [Diplonema papillatum]
MPRSSPTPCSPSQLAIHPTPVQHPAGVVRPPQLSPRPIPAAHATTPHLPSQHTRAHRLRSPQSISPAQGASADTSTDRLG